MKPHYDRHGYAIVHGHWLHRTSFGKWFLLEGGEMHPHEVTYPTIKMCTTEEEAIELARQRRLEGVK